MVVTTSQVRGKCVQPRYIAGYSPPSSAGVIPFADAQLSMPMAPVVPVNAYIQQPQQQQPWPTEQQQPWPTEQQQPMPYMQQPQQAPYSIQQQQPPGAPGYYTPGAPPQTRY